ncbi:EscU/YscU/HrcU family type III secretion system export apparatus switch protein [Curtobacterium sp. MCBD17_040]|uniref:EscU/YscU/HrcU family type III secretion system export apparatus switch protein n=1 Tax=Curtobacterium sp. MCBD17_040 TaxID=2175674 RepID=UPI000DA71990|nr:EscU/YscU/HrcU family type III secretion system export apparatus switch protein [Curtobacterium sp. MCBD17_040]WIB65592.1 EscU/YscU/HrcU family type III secretion system export apparatus switch protein [Curtobacterium sp. MCBD17_040]
MADSGERTEQATEKHLKEVRRKGSLTKSRDLPAWVGLAGAAIMVPATVQRAQQAAMHQVLSIRDVIQHPDAGAAVTYMRDALGSVGVTLWPLFAVSGIAVIAAYVAQGNLYFKAPTLRLSQLNPMTGIVHMFSTRTLWEAAKTILKSAAVALVLWGSISGLTPIVQALGALPLASILGTAENGVWGLVRTTIAAGIVFGGFDVIVIMRRNRKQTMMTKQQVKDEQKSSDGDPMVRAHRRSRQMAMSRNRMIQAIKDADVVVVNPTHIAVALRYVPGKSAPRVVAKGADNIAVRIREEARDTGVPLVRDVPLARALHQRCKLGDEIPHEYFPVVANILVFVRQLKQRGASLSDVHDAPVR